MEIQDLGKPRYGTQDGTRLRYKLLDPKTGGIRWLDEIETRARFDPS
jgi:hypothetical protein